MKPEKQIVTSLKLCFLSESDCRKCQYKKDKQCITHLIEDVIELIEQKNKQLKGGDKPK